MLILDKSASQQTPLLALLSLGNREVACVLEITDTTYHGVEVGWGRKEHLMDARTVEEGARWHPELSSLPTHSRGSGGRCGEGNACISESRGVWRKTV